MISAREKLLPTSLSPSCPFVLPSMSSFQLQGQGIIADKELLLAYIQSIKVFWNIGPIGYELTSSPCWSLLLVHAWRIPLSSKLKAPCSSIPLGHLSESWPRGTVPWSSIPLNHISERWPRGKLPLAALLQFTSLKADPGEQLLVADSLQFTSLKAGPWEQLPAAASVQPSSLEQPSLQAQPGARKMFPNFGKRNC